MAAGYARGGAAWELSNASKDDVDETSYDQHENCYEGENPKDPEPLAVFIGMLVIAERRGHRDLP
jgi:hypothetical protein